MSTLPHVITNPYFESEQPDGQLAAHQPLLRLAVRITAVVDEAGVVPLESGQRKRVGNLWMCVLSPLYGSYPLYYHMGCHADDDPLGPHMTHFLQSTRCPMHCRL